MEKEFEIDRENIARYFKWQQLAVNVLLVPYFGLGIITGLIYYYKIAPWLPKMQAEAIKYRLDEKFLRVDTGVYFLRRNSILLERITDIDIFQDPLMRHFGLWKLRVKTSSFRQPAVLFGIDNPEQVRDEIFAARDAYLQSHESSSMALP
jgi:membrane protein YdbS with pleckstrin-like domain